MMPVEIDPSQVRQPRRDPHESVRARLGRPAILAALAVVGIGGCAGLAAAAYPTLSDLLRPRPPEVHFGRVAEMPEIKDGIPALRANPVRQVPIVQAPATPSSSVQASAPAVPAALLDPKPTVATVPPQSAPAQGSLAQASPVRGSWSPASDVAATGTAAAFQPVPKAPETPRPAPVREARVTAETAMPRAVPAPRETAPLPPARAKAEKAETKPAASPRETVTEKATPRPAPAREAKAEPAKPAPAKPIAEKAVAEKAVAEKHAAEKPVARREKPDAHQRSAAAQPAAAPAAEEPTRFLGVPMPDFAPAGRAIKETVDAVISLPSRL
ncbi:hypothetical protein [Methylobacterium sp. Gmos1]